MDELMITVATAVLAVAVSAVVGSWAGGLAC